MWLTDNVAAFDWPRCNKCYHRIQKALHLVSAMAMAPEPKPLHVLLVPFPAQGHLIPASVLAQRFASLGISTTLIILKHKSEDLSPSNARSGFLANPLIHTHYLQPQIPPDSSSHSQEASAKVENLVSLMLHQSPLLRAQIEDFIQSLSSNPHFLPPCCIITDQIMSWVEDIACKFELPWFLFNTSAATYLGTNLHALTLLKEIPIQEENMDDPVQVPDITLPDLRIRHLSTALRERSSLRDFLLSFARRLRKASAILINSFEAAEMGGVEAINSGNPNPVPIYMVGPLIPDFRIEKENECIQWLNSQRTRTVLYISFGSLIAIPDQQVVEIAKGLESLKQPFLWVWRMEHENVVEKLPEKFIKRSQGYGKIICGWVPQLQILQHRAMGAFLSHGGWNSCLESFFMGVPLLVLPYLYDQILDCKMVAEGLKVGLEIKKSSNGIANHQVFEKVVGLIMSEDPASLSIRHRANLLSNQAKNAAASSISSLESFAKVLHNPNL